MPEQSTPAADPMPQPVTDSLTQPSDESHDAINFAHRLFDGARDGEFELVTSAIDQGVPVDLTDAHGNTLLMLAAYFGHAALVAALAERGADVNCQNDRGQTPLAGAVFKRATDVIDTLLSHGADLDAGTPSARATAQMFNVTLDSDDDQASATKLP